MALLAPLRVLLVEDNPGDARLLAHALFGDSHQGRFELRQADRLTAAEATLRDEQVDVALLDLGLPDSAGLETFERLHRVSPDTPVVILTGNRDDRAAVAAVQAGAQDYIVKGTLSDDVLARTIRHAAERARLQQELQVHLRQRAALVELGRQALEGVDCTRLRRLTVDLVADVLGVPCAAITEQRGTGAIPAVSVSAGRSALAEGDRADDTDLQRHGFASSIRVPIGGLDGVTGEILAADDTPRTFATHDVSFLEGLAHALAEASARKQAQRALADRLDELARSEAALRASEERLRDALAVEREATERLRHLDELKNTFLSAVSHELRTPLTAVLGLSATLEQLGEELPSEQRHLVFARLLANAERLRRLLEELLDLDRLSRGVLTAQRAPVDVHALVTEVVGDLDLGDHDLEVRGIPVVADIDAARVGRIVENLVVNAVRHTPQHGKILVAVEPADGGVLLSVEDDGAGVPDELKTAIFEPFRHGETPAAHVGGTGIGLTVVARFAELHGGRAWVEDRPGGGACFHVHLPDATVKSDTVAPTIEEAAPVSPAPGTRLAGTP